MCHDTVFKCITFPPNLRVSEGENAWRSNLQGLLILVSLALMNVGDVQGKAGVEIGFFLTELRNDPNWVEGLQKLSVLLLGMCLSPVSPLGLPCVGSGCVHRLFPLLLTRHLLSPWLFLCVLFVCVCVLRVFCFWRGTRMLRLLRRASVLQSAAQI